MLYVYHHIWPFGRGEEIGNRQKERIFGNIKDFTYIPNVVPKNENENHTLYKMWEDSKLISDDTIILYIHNKGATKKGTDALGMDELTDIIESELVDNYKHYIDVLDEGYHSTAGVMCGVPFWADTFYAGNIFWITAKYLKELPPTDYLYVNSYVAEAMFLQRGNWKPYSRVYTINHNLYPNFIKLYLKHVTSHVSIPDGDLPMNRTELI